MRAVLRSWKAIANYFDTSTRTVQRWERELGLPVRRIAHSRGSVVLAYEEELEDWFRTRAVARLGIQMAGRRDWLAEQNKQQPSLDEDACLEFLRKVLDGIPVQIWTGPADGTLDFCNLRWRAELGLGLDELKGFGWRQMIHPEHQERVWRAWSESVRQGLAYEQEELHRMANGEYRWFLCRGVPLRDGRGNVVRWMGCNIDIHQQKMEDASRTGEQVAAVADMLNGSPATNRDKRR